MNAINKWKSWAACSLLAFLIGPVHAQPSISPGNGAQLDLQPWSGAYFTPGADGNGWMIDFSNNGKHFFATFQSFDTAGTPVWFTLQSDSADGITPACVPYSRDHQFSTGEVCAVTGPINRFTGGQCPGCTYRPPIGQAGALGTGQLVFLDGLNRAEFRSNGEVVPLQRLFDQLSDNVSGKAAVPGFVGEWKVYEVYSRRECPDCSAKPVRLWTANATVKPRTSFPPVRPFTAPAGTAAHSELHLALPGPNVAQYEVDCNWRSGAPISLFPLSGQALACEILGNTGSQQNYGSFLYQEPGTGVLRGIQVCSNFPSVELIADCERFENAPGGNLTRFSAAVAREDFFMSPDGNEMRVRVFHPGLFFPNEQIWIRESAPLHIEAEEIPSL
ncbi:MAG: hypothetical protein AB7F83_14525 [Lysobacterales bacterium]